MSSVRQNKIASLLKRELSMLFQQEAPILCMGSMVTVTIVRVTPDLGLAKVYLSVFAAKDKQAVLAKIKEESGEIKYKLGKKLRNQLRYFPNIEYYLDDSLDYAEEIDDLLKS